MTKMERDKFGHMAYTDYLTGAYNRAYMDERFAELNRMKDNVGIVVTDIDHFKMINDNYNHTVGDQVIRHFASTLELHLTENDLLIRTGGEEFTLLLMNRTAEECKLLVELIRLQVEQSTVKVNYKESDTLIRYSASFGLSYHTGSENFSMETGYVQIGPSVVAIKTVRKKPRNRLSPII